jgi:hypothetical protein
MSVTMKVSASGQEVAGALSAEAGASVEIVPVEGKTLSLSLDYKSPDRIVVTAAGTMMIAHSGLELTGGVDLNLVNGETEFTGKVSYTISKDVSAVVSGGIGPQGVGASAGLTIRFA